MMVLGHILKLDFMKMMIHMMDNLMSVTTRLCVGMLHPQVQQRPQSSPMCATLFVQPRPFIPTSGAPLEQPSHRQSSIVHADTLAQQPPQSSMRATPSQQHPQFIMRAAPSQQHPQSSTRAAPSQQHPQSTMRAAPSQQHPQSSMRAAPSPSSPLNPAMFMSSSRSLVWASIQGMVMPIVLHIMNM